MLCRIVVENLSDRVFRIARNEAETRGEVLRCVDHLGDKKFLWLAADDTQGIADVVSTLETERRVNVISVEDTQGNSIAFRHRQRPTVVDFNRFTLELIA